MAPHQVSINDFHILKELGRGGSGVVFEAIWWDRRCHVAIKRIYKELKDRKKCIDVDIQARREIEIHSKLSHPSIVQLLASFEDKEFFYLVLELCKNGSLEEYLKYNKPLAESKVRSFLKPVIEGVMYMHKNHFMHQDLTLKNLLLTDDMKECKIIDFGLARYVPGGDKSCTILGTPNFMAPETILGEPHDKAVDCWGLGIILYTLLIGEPPFDKEGRKVPDILTDIIWSDIKDKGLLNILTKNARNLIMSLLKKNKEERIKIGGVLNHAFFTGKTLPVKNYTNYSQKTIDSGLGSTGSSSFATNSRLLHSKHTSSTVRKGLDTIKSYSDDSNIEDSESESYNDIFTKCNANPQLVQYRNYKKNERSSGEQLRNKIQPLPSKRYDFLSDVPEPTSSHGRTKYMKHSDRLDYISKSAHKGHSGETHTNSKNRQKTDYYRSRSMSPVIQSDKNNYYSDSCVEEDYIDKFANCKIRNEANSWEQKERPENHNPRQQCIDNYHRGNSRSPTRSPISVQEHISSSHVSDRHSYNHSHDKFHQHEQTHCGNYEHQLLVTNRVNGLKENHVHHIPVRYCNNDRCCTFENTALHTHSNHNQDNCVINKQAPSITKLEKPLNTIRLKDRRHRGNNAVISILKSGDVCLEILKEKKYVTKVYRISKNGMTITIYKPSSTYVVKDEPPPIPKRRIVCYNYEDLPEQHRKIYKYASNFVSCVQAKTAKITFHGDRVKGVMMENSPPDYELLFYDGGKITKSAKRIILITKTGMKYDFNYKEKGIGLVGEDEDVIVSENVALVKEAKDMWIYFQKIYKFCLSQAEEQEAKEKYMNNLGLTLYPTVYGKRREKSSGLQNSNKENNTPSSIRSSTLNVMSFNGSVDTNYSPIECQSQKLVNTRHNSQASIKSKRSTSTLTSMKLKMKEPKTKVNISNDEEGNFCAKFEDGIEFNCTKGLTGIYIYDKNNDVGYDNVYDESTDLPPHCKEKLRYVGQISCDLEKKRNRKILR